MVFRLGLKMNYRAKLVMLIVCTACIATIWRTSHFFLKPLKENEQNRRPCSCSTCMSEFNDFFMKRYNKSVNPFLTPMINVTQEDFQWWKTLQVERGNLSAFHQAKTRLFKVFLSEPDLTEPSPDRCRTCAVVGNSGNLKGSKYGSQIDAYDVVIRMNTGQTAGYEEDVGSKTTHRVMYPESAMDLDNSTHLVLVPFKIMDLQWLTETFTTGFHGRSYAPVREKIKANKNLVMIVNPAFMKYVHTSWLNGKGRYPSTGFMTLVLTMHICDQVNVFGFGADKNGNWNHYWEELKNMNLKTGVHPGTQEYNLIQELAKQNKLTFYKGW